MDASLARDIMRNAAEAHGILTTHRPHGDVKFYLAVEVLDLWRAGPVIEACTLRGLAGAKVSDTGLATYIYWEEYVCGSI